jgi:hypothetical protein
MAELSLRVVLERPTPGADFGLQRGRGGDYQTVQTQRSLGGDLHFEFTPVVKPGPDFSGPFVQGARGGRFVYIDIGTYAGQKETPWSRRLKIPLSGITAGMIAAGGTIEARVAGSGRDGSPSCGTVKDVVWKPAR